MLYHYTNISVLYKILESRRLRLTNIDCFKDTFEFKHAISMLSKELSLPLSMEKHLISELKQLSRLIYVFCFCKEKDKEYLFQRYGDLNIGFHKRDLLAMLAYQASFIQSYRFIECNYDELNQQEIIKDAVKQWEQEGNFIPGYKLCLLATHFKSSAYKEENETRLIVQLNKSNRIMTGENNANERSSRISNFWELRLRSFHTDLVPFRSITLGPKFKYQDTVCKLQDELNTHGLESVEINSTLFR